MNIRIMSYRWFFPIICIYSLLCEYSDSIALNTIGTRSVECFCDTTVCNRPRGNMESEIRNPDFGSWRG
jgi:hypothetical protein